MGFDMFCWILLFLLDPGISILFLVDPVWSWQDLAGPKRSCLGPESLQTLLNLPRTSRIWQDQQNHSRQTRIWRNPQELVRPVWMNQDSLEPKESGRTHKDQSCSTLICQDTARSRIPSRIQKDPPWSVSTLQVKSGPAGHTRKCQFQ